MKTYFAVYLLGSLLVIVTLRTQAQRDPTCDYRQVVVYGNNIVNNTNCFPGVYIGYGLSNNLTNAARYNTIVGLFAGSNITDGSSNVMMGTFAGSNLTTGSGNFFIGDHAGGQNTTGGFNVYLGANSGNGTGVNGDNNVAIGFESGRQNAGGVTNLFLGFRADAGANNLRNATAIGPNAQVDVSNALVLGNNANIGIGTVAPTNKLHIATGQAHTSGIRLENLTSTSPASVLNEYKFLTVDGAGNVILGSINGSARVAATDALWQRNGQTLQSTNGEDVVIGKGVSKIPVGYKLYVQDGILTEKVKVAVKNTADWSDKVFEAGYRLKSLEEVEQHIKQKGHLPSIPSATEVVEKGLDLGRMDAKLLEKIEELTLYSIQLKQANNKQQAEIDELKQLVNQLLKKNVTKR